MSPEEIYNLLKNELELAQAARHILDNWDQYDESVLLVLDEMLISKKEKGIEELSEIIPKENLPWFFADMFFELGFYFDSKKLSAPDEALKQMAAKYKTHSKSELKKWQTLLEKVEKELLKDELLKV